MHLDLEHSGMSSAEQLAAFSKDVAKAHAMMESFGFGTSLFVYPYDYACYGSSAVLKKHGYTVAWPSEGH